MKRLLCVLIAAITIMSAFGVTAFGAGDVAVTVNGKEIEFDQPPVIMGGRTLVPARAVFEATGASVYWDENENGGYVSVVTADTSIVLEVNRKEAVDYMTVDNLVKVVLDVPATIVGGRTLVPLRAIGDALSCEVGWDSETRTASLEYSVPEKSVLSEEINAKNTALTAKEAAEALKKASANSQISSAPKYNNGIKYFDAVAADEQKKYIKSAGEDIKSEEFPLYAVIDDEYVTADELEYFLAIYTDSQGNILPENEELAKYGIRELAVSSVYAKNNGIKMNRELIEIINVYLSSITYGLDLDTFASLSGISKDVVYSIAERHALRNALYVKAAEEGELDVSDSAVKEKFNSLFYKAKHILVKTVDDSMNPVTVTAKKAAKTKIDGILAKIKKGEDFDKLMKENSEDAESSFEGYVFTDGHMVKSFEDGVKALKAGEVSPVIESEYGYHIIKRLELDADAEKEEYEYYKSSVINILASEYFQAKTEEWAANMNIKTF